MRTRVTIDFTLANRSYLDMVIAGCNRAQKHVWRSPIVVLSADGCGTIEVMQLTGTHKTYA